MESQTNNSSATILSLPNELIVMILEKLSIYDKMSLSMTCTKLHNIFNSTPTLHKDKILKIYGENHKEILKTFCCNKNENVHHIILLNIEFVNCINFIYYRKFWNNCGEYILSLRIIDCDHLGNDNILSDILSNCTNLEELKVLSSSDWTKALNKCSELKYNNLEKLECDVLSDYSLNNFIYNSPKLKHLDINGNKNGINCDDGFCQRKRMKISIKDKEMFPKMANTNNLTIENLEQVLPLSKINSWVSRNIYPDKNVSYISPSEVKLEAIEFRDRINYFNIFKYLAKNYANTLKYLDFSGYRSYYGELYGLSNLKNLQTLKLPVNVAKLHVKDDLQFLKKLENLELHKDCYSRDSMKYGMNPNQVLLSLPKLHSLTLYSNYYLLTLHEFLNDSNTSLIELHILYYCDLLSCDKFFPALFNNHKLLKKLTLNCCLKITDEHICGSNNNNIGISSLKDLTSLSLDRFVITDLSIINQFKWKELTTLNLSHNIKITDAALLSLSKNCPAIVDLNLSGCTLITDEGIKHLCNLTRLRKLNVQYTKVTGLGLYCLIKLSRTLKNITCNKIMDQDVRNELLKLAWSLDDK